MNDKQFLEFINGLPLDAKEIISKLALGEAASREYNERMLKSTPVPELRTAPERKVRGHKNEIKFDAFDMQFTIIIDHGENSFSLVPLPHRPGNMSHMSFRISFENGPPFVMDDFFQSSEVVLGDRSESYTYISNEMRYTLILALLTVVKRYVNILPQDIKIQRWNMSVGNGYLPLVEYMKTLKAQVGGDRSKIRFNQLIYKIRVDKDKQNYIMCMEGRVYLKDIRGRYRYV